MSQGKNKEKQDRRNETGKSAMVVKSPSDTTIYSPALRKLGSHGLGDLTKESPIRQIICHEGENQIESLGEETNSSQKLSNKEPLDKAQVYADAASQSNQNKLNQFTEQIVHFIEGIRMHGADDQPTTSDGRRGNEDGYECQINEVRNKTDQSILAAEHFKAVVNNPTVRRKTSIVMG